MAKRALPTRTGKKPKKPLAATTPAERRRLTGIAESPETAGLSVRKGRPLSEGKDEDGVADISDDDAKIVEDGLRKLQNIMSAEAPQRSRELEDLLFDRALPEDQWPSAIWNDRNGTTDGSVGGTTAARPCLVIPKLDQPVQQVLNEISDANLGIRVTAKSGAGKKDAEVRQGLIRCIEQDSFAKTAYDWGGGRMVKCGRGAWRVNKRFMNDGDFELDLAVDRILNQGSVYVDPFATEATWADMDHAFILYDYPEDVYLSKFGEAKRGVALANDPGVLQGILSEFPDWVTMAAGLRVFRVAEYFQAIYTDDVLYQRVGADGQPVNVFKSELQPEQAAAVEDLIKNKSEGVKKREVSRRSIRWVTMDAFSVLDREDWEGRYIPVVPCVGKEYYVNGQRCFKGLISNAKDAQRSYNYMRSAQVEAVGLAPRAPWVMAEGQDEGYEQMWQEANVRNFPYLIYRPVNLDGQLAPPPQRNVAEPALQGITLAVREADADIKATTGRYDPSLGQQKGDASGKAITALQMQGQQGTSNYTDSQALAITYTGMILNDMLEHVYNTPGRIARLLGEEGKERAVLINQPFTTDEDGEPQPADPEDPEAEFFDLGKGQFLVRVSASRSYKTAQEESARVLEAIFQAAPQLVPLAADLWVEQLDTPQAAKIAERLREANPALAKKEDPGLKKLPPAAKAKIEQLSKQLEAVGAQHEQLVQVAEKQSEQLKGRQVEAEAEAKEKAGIDRDKLALEKLKLQAELRMKAAELMSSDSQNMLNQRVKLVTDLAKLELGKARDEMQTEADRLEAEISRRHEYMLSIAELDATERSEGRTHAREDAQAIADRLAAAEDEDGDLPPLDPAAPQPPPPLTAPPTALAPPAPAAPGFEAPTV